MIHREVALEALSTICKAEVTSLQSQGSDGGSQKARLLGGAVLQLPVKSLIQKLDVKEDTTGKLYIIDEEEFFDPGYDYDFRDVHDTKKYLRGDEVYERPCGWYRFALKVLGKYDNNTWLGNNHRSTQSVAGEWPVSYHGTSQKGAEGIIEGHYKPGERELYGHGIYSTPHVSVANGFAKTFTSKKTGKTYKVILQNRINPKYREKHHGDQYWLVRIPSGTSKKEVQEMADRAIRPYSLLLKEV